MLQDLAWSQQIPALAHLLSPADVPRRDECSPRPLLPEQDQLIEQELKRRDEPLEKMPKAFCWPLMAASSMSSFR